MKRVANCLLKKGEQVLMLQKPRRGWWVVPGGKVETTETIQEAVIREFYEETNLKLINPVLRGVFNIIIKDGEKFIEEWMMFTYFADSYTGELNLDCEEGILEWKNINEILALPKAQGDNIYLEHILNSDEVITGKFIYTPDYELIAYSMDKKMETIS
ncbi:NUDIX hydrolase [Vulcanibacillus modesticaldus]|uniref:NUDIX hydrolase n=1 Tax=Vulcanibacillus modesticaldus TaxID=337097 RepID=A0A1D2YT24_9BACI|nr:8-oxo-dGTP diphosphatase [Vulcanibacillus modesticaldus]OEF98827.1 NUDIX hydrolase [Vulcanibacillus modesticaldus]